MSQRAPFDPGVKMGFGSGDGFLVDLRQRPRDGSIHHQGSTVALPASVRDVVGRVFGLPAVLKSAEEGRRMPVAQKSAELHQETKIPNTTRCDQRTTAQSQKTPAKQLEAGRSEWPYNFAVSTTAPPASRARYERYSQGVRGRRVQVRWPRRRRSGGLVTVQPSTQVRRAKCCQSIGYGAAEEYPVAW